MLSDNKIELIIIRRVMMIVFSHRHSKQDKFVLEIEQEKQEDTQIDFSIIRDVMYHYSKKV
jgi:hypothetical protein